MAENIIENLELDPGSQEELEELEELEASEQAPVPAPAAPTFTEPVEVVDVRFKVGGKVYYFDPAGLHIAAGDNVIIETSRGVEYGECTLGNHLVEPSRVVPPLRPVLRIATEKDLETLAANQKKEKRAFEVCQQKITEHKLDMKLIDVEYSFDGSKILFFFTSDGRVDFRELVKNLASVFRTRIELRQIGVRDEAKMLGGLGICGRPFCCSSFLDDFHPVSIKMAKTQNLSLNPTKISGTCGRLMCCLKYEQDAYEDMLKRTPKLESYVETPQGKGTVVDVCLLRSTVKVSLENEPETLKTYKTNQITVLHNGSRNKKSAPLLPPDPPILDDDYVEETKAESPEIIYSAHETAAPLRGEVPETAAKAEAGQSGQEAQGSQRRSRSRSRNKKKPDAQAGQRQPAAEQRSGQGEQKPPRTEQRPGQGEQNARTEQKQPRAEQGRPQQEQKKPQQQPQKQKQQPSQNAQNAQKAEPRAEGAEKPTGQKNNRGRYYRGKRRRPPSGDDKQ